MHLRSSLKTRLRLAAVCVHKTTCSAFRYGCSYCALVFFVLSSGLPSFLLSFTLEPSSSFCLFSSSPPIGSTYELPNLAHRSPRSVALTLLSPRPRMSFFFRTTQNKLGEGIKIPARTVSRFKIQRLVFCRPCIMQYHGTGDLENLREMDRVMSRPDRFRSTTLPCKIKR